MSNRKKILTGLLVVVLLTLPFGVHWYVGMEARHFGREAADEAVARANRANFAESEWNKLLELARNEDFRTLIEEEFNQQCIDASWFIRAMIENEYGQTDEQLAAILEELLPEPASAEECAIAGEPEQQDVQAGNIETTTTLSPPDD